MCNLTMGSLFDGSGGFPYGALLSGITPIWASEIEPFPIRVTTKRLPFMKHYGDVRKISGAEIEPVDIITFGSPCTDMSSAGARTGLKGSQSVLFFEAIRIIKEMRRATNGRYPRFCLWENVPGAYSSSGGRDFREVLSEIVGIKAPELSVPMPESDKWLRAGEIVGDGYSAAWRSLDAQFWGVAQRRLRCYLVADFAGECAGKILFESEGMSGHPPQSGGAGQGAAANAQGGAGASGREILNDQGGGVMNISENVVGTLQAQEHDRQPLVFEPGAVSRIGGHAWHGTAGALRADPGDNLQAVVIENHPADSRIKLDESGTMQTLTGRMGTGGGNTPLIMNTPKAYGISAFESNAMKSPNPHSGYYEADTARTIDGNGGSPACNQGGIAICERDTSRYALTTGSFMQVCTDQAATLQARDFKDPQCVNQPQYTVRRLTPEECAVLQGIEPTWCANLETPDPTEDDIAWWSEVFEVHRKIMGKSAKPKSRNQIIKWLKNPHSDSAEYKMWGNGVALPCVRFVMSGIVRCVNIAM